jgi:hypothetical protein
MYELVWCSYIEKFEPLLQTGEFISMNIRVVVYRLAKLLLINILIISLEENCFIGTISLCKLWINLHKSGIVDGAKITR